MNLDKSNILSVLGLLGVPVILFCMVYATSYRLCNPDLTETRLLFNLWPIVILFFAGAGLFAGFHLRNKE